MKWMSLPVRVAVGFTLVICMAAQTTKGRFVLDPERPFVDIVFERVGHREPVFPRESSAGIWLKLRNNSTYPVVVGVLTRENKNAGALIVHEVRRVENPVPLPPGDQQKFQEPTQYYLAGDVRNTLEILPGRELRFSVPIEEITRQTFIRIQFDLRFPSHVSGRQPRTFVEFYWIDLPPETRRVSETRGPTGGSPPRHR